MATELGGKWLELLKETVPAVSRVAVLWSAGFEMEPTWKGMQATARSLGVELQSAQVKAYFARGFGYADVEMAAFDRTAFTWATRGQAGAFILLPSSIFGRKTMGYIADLP